MSLGNSASPLGKVRGIGSAEEGGGHWISERVTSIALVLLGAWFIVSLLLLPDLKLPTVREWLRAPSGAIPMTLFVLTSFIHGLDGLKVVVDDYIDDHGNNFAVNLILFFLAVAGAAIALFALARIAFGGNA